MLPETMDFINPVCGNPVAVGRAAVCDGEGSMTPESDIDEEEGSSEAMS